MNVSRRQFLQFLGALPAASALALSPVVLAKRMPDVLLEEKSPIERLGILVDLPEQSLEVERISWDIKNEYARLASTNGSVFLGPLVHQRRTLHVLTYDARAPNLIDAFYELRVITLKLHLRQSPAASYTVEGCLTNFSAAADDRVSFSFDMELMKLLGAS